MSKSQTHRLWRRFTKKINSHNEVILTSILMSNMKVTKLFKNTFYAHFESFWSPSYVMSKLTSICVNLIVWIYFFCEPPPWSMCLTFWHFTSFWQLDIFLITWHIFWHVGNGTHGQMSIMVNTEHRDGHLWGWGTWVMGHMATGAHGQWDTWAMGTWAKGYHG